MRSCGFCGDSGHNRRTCNQRSDASKKVDNTYYRKKSCGYCGNPGHTRPTCSQMDIDRDKWVSENAAYRKLVLEDIKNNGFGVGAVFGEMQGDKKTSAKMVRAIKWDAITHTELWSYSVQFVDMRTGMTGFTCIPIVYGHEGKQRLHYEKYDGNTVFVPASEDALFLNMPADWLSGKSGIPNHMVKKERKKRNEG